MKHRMHVLNVMMFMMNIFNYRGALLLPEKDAPGISADAIVYSDSTRWYVSVQINVYEDYPGIYLAYGHRLTAGGQYKSMGVLIERSKGVWGAEFIDDNPDWDCIQ